LYVHQAGWTFLAVGYPFICPSSGPFLKIFISSLKGSTGEVIVPRGVAFEAPLMAARFAGDFQILLL
jgi:hypothetical protein